MKLLQMKLCTRILYGLRRSRWIWGDVTHSDEEGVELRQGNNYSMFPNKIFLKNSGLKSASTGITQRLTLSSTYPHNMGLTL